MDVLDYLEEHGLPPMTAEWGYRETLSGELSEPILLLSVSVKIEGYADIVYELADISDVHLQLGFCSEGWFVDPRIGEDQSDDPIVVHPYSDTNSMTKRIEMKRGREMQTLWTMGFPALLRVVDLIDTGFSRTRPGIMFDVGGGYALLSPEIAGTLIGKLYSSPAPDFNRMGIWKRYRSSEGYV